MNTYNAKASRAKRPCPFWVDSFQRDTQHLSADEVGAYMLILMAMWTRESCDLPNDDHRLSRIARVSLRLWRDRIGPVIRAFLSVDGDAVVQKRLRKEAAYVEAELIRQSDRKRGVQAEPQGSNEHSQKDGKKSSKLLKSKEQGPTADISTEATTEPTFLQPNNPTVGVEEVPSSTPKEEEEARASPILNRVMEAVGIDPVSPPPYWRGKAAAENVVLWMGLGLTVDEIVEAARQSRLTHPEPPDGPKALDGVMNKRASSKRAAAAKAKKAGKTAAAAPPPVDPATGEPVDHQKDRNKRIADWVKRGTCPANMVKPSDAQMMLKEGWVTEAQLKHCGIIW